MRAIACSALVRSSPEADASGARAKCFRRFDVSAHVIERHAEVRQNHRRRSNGDGATEAIGRARPVLRIDAHDAFVEERARCGARA